MRNAPSRLVLHAVLALLVILWGTTWAAIRVGLESVPPFTGAALRFAIGAAILFAVAPLFKVGFGRSAQEIRVWLANGIFMFVGSYGVVYWAEQWVPSGLAAILFATFPLFVALLAHFLVPGERLNRGMIVGVLIALAGVAILSSGSFTGLHDRKAAVATIVFLLSPISAGLGNVLVKRWGKGMHPVSTTTIPMLIGAVGLGAAAALLERGAPVRYDATSIGIIAYLALFGTVVTFVLYFWALEHMPVTKLALIAYLTPVVAVAIGTIFLGEPFTVRLVIGAVAVICGVILAGRAKPGGSPARARISADDFVGPAPTDGPL